MNFFENYLFYLLRTFCPHLGSFFFFCLVSSFTTFRPNFTSGLLQVILPRPRIGMLSLVTVSPGKCDDRDETINHIISECSKVAQKEYKTRHDWVGNAIHWELCKKLKFHHTTKWYGQEPEFVLENETQKII